MRGYHETTLSCERVDKKLITRMTRFIWPFLSGNTSLPEMEVG